MKPICLLSPWFGPWPEWIEFFVESCKWNPEIDWVIHTDQPPPENSAPNVAFRQMPFDDFKRILSDRLGIETGHVTPYKLCDFKPVLGHVFEAELEGYGHFGYCDVDVVFGDVRAYFTDELLARYDAISALPGRIAGHLSVFRNTPRSRNRFRQVSRWRGLLSSPDYRGMDEGDFTKVFRPRKRRFIRRMLAPRSLFAHLAPTPGGGLTMPDGSPIPLHWEWNRGKLSHEKCPDGTVYLHMMNWQSDRWLAEGAKAPWPRLPNIVQCDWREAAERGFTISPEGIRLRQ